MDVKDVGRRVVKDALSPITLQQALRRPKDSPDKPSATTTSDVVVNAESIPSSVVSDLRKGLNEAISSINIAADATDSIGKYLESIHGVIEQAQTPKELSPQRQQALEKEANQLVDEIKRTAKAVADVPSGVGPNDDVRKEIEEKLGKTLDALLPEDASRAFGIGPISFSRRDSIIQTITNVTAARQRIDEVRKAVQDSSSSLKNAVLSFEVAEQNGEASRVSVRDLDKAAELASTTESKIFQNPDTALNSVGNLVVRSLELLK